MPDTTTSPDPTSYYYLRGKRVPLEADPTDFVVAFAPGKRLDDDTLSPRMRKFLTDEAESVGNVPQYGLQVFRIKPSVARFGIAAIDPSLQLRASRQILLENLVTMRDEPAILQSSPVLRRSPGSARTSFTTRQFLVAFKPEVNDSQIQALHQRHGAEMVKRLDYVANGYLLRSPKSDGERGPVAISNAYFESGLCEFAHPDFIEERVPKASASAIELPRLESRDEDADAFASPRDTEFLDRQWHLQTAKVRDAWSLCRGSADICVAVLDDGVDVGHAEFAGKVAAQFDYQTNTADGSPKADSDKHGTSCAGVAVAKGVKASGAAPLCRLIAVRTPAFLGVADEAEMFRWTADQGADVISCSWGPADNAGPFALVDNVRAAINYCTTRGRGGKGIPVFFAAGNGNESVSDDGYAANPDVFAIAASTASDSRSPYSDFGPEIFICAPSSGGTADPKIFTTDRRGAAGYNSGDTAKGDAAGDYTSRFGGTSSACPLVAGIAGLVLSANPALTRDQVRDILKTTTDKIGGAAAYNAQGHSSQFGFGRVNALAAVRAAQNRSGGTTGTAPSISAPQSASPSQPPTFNINLGRRAVYAVELATDHTLLDTANQARRTTANHYGGWVDGLKSTPTWQPPPGVWSTLAASRRVFYRGHFADDQSWANYEASPDLAQVRSIQTSSSQPETPGPSPESAGEPSIQAPSSASSMAAPSFQVRTGSSRLFAIEFATSNSLMDNANASQRTASNHYGSWSEGLKPAGSYSPPSNVWRTLAASGRVFYRGHFADDNAWSNYKIWPADASPLAIAISGAAPTDEDQPQDQPQDQPTTPTVPETLRFPSGASFRSVTQTADSIDYSDPVANGIVPLIEVRGRENESLSTNFIVKELMAPGTRYARISPNLVQALQATRTRLGSPLKIESAYRHPALNTQLRGDEQSEHMTGRAATLRSTSSTVRPIDIARAALLSVDEEMGLGLGPTSLHLNVAGAFSTWVYEGASMSEDEFASFARSIRASRAEGVERSVEFADRSAPDVQGPMRYPRGKIAPSFSIVAPAARFFAFEIAASWRLFQPGYSDLRREDNFYATWGDPHIGLLPLGRSGKSVFTLPDEVWGRLRHADALYYRVLTTTQRSKSWEGFASSMPDDRAFEARQTDLFDLFISRDGTAGPRFFFASASVDDPAF